MSRVILILLIASLIAGCAGVQNGESNGFVQRYSGSRRLALAVEMLENGKTSAAAKELNAICAGSAVPGVTDEALFRLALLSLKPSGEKPVSAQGQQLLRRLRKEYPASPWTVQAAPLVDLLEVAEELRQQNKNLKASNQSLAREVSELSKSIQQLKNLDLELEQKSR
ncbi:MAG: hypothetical protein A2075_05370 [Geobacteraceae bacterium GWC2_58_44]|nr:MAG: hypothetical protein A2075_05370 [Geobacteraceae bacterium GWC2_58_44]HBG08209.1 hypothetical protein [Geobacter sp.]